MSTMSLSKVVERYVLTCQEAKSDTAPPTRFSLQAWSVGITYYYFYLAIFTTTQNSNSVLLHNLHCLDLPPAFCFCWLMWTDTQFYTSILALYITIPWDYSYYYLQTELQRYMQIINHFSWSCQRYLGYTHLVPSFCHLSEFEYPCVVLKKKR